jgi:hypothetical protein
MMRAVVALAAAIRETGINGYRGQRLGSIRILHMRQAGTVTRLALHIVIAWIFDRLVAAGRGSDIASLTYGMAAFTDRLRRATRLQSRPRIRMGGLIPLILNADVTITAYHELRGRIAVADKTGCGRLHRREKIPVPENYCLIRACACQQDDR